jgi:hypothetical protein
MKTEMQMVEKVIILMEVRGPRGGAVG